MSTATFNLAGDLEVNRLGFGTIHLTTQRGFGPPRSNAKELLKKTVSLGVNFIDTAYSYGPEHAENVIREALYPYTKGLVIASKGGFVHTSLENWEDRGRPDHLRKTCDSSLKRLKVERIGLYQLHVPDPKVPYAESIGALRELQNKGRSATSGCRTSHCNSLRKRAPKSRWYPCRSPSTSATGRTRTSWSSARRRGLRSLPGCRSRTSCGSTGYTPIPDHSKQHSSA